MSQTVALFFYYLFWQRVMRFLFAAGAVMLGAGVAWRALGDADPLQLLPVLFGLILTIGVPTVFAGIAFRQLVSNVRLTLVPSLRQKAGLALLLLVVVASVLAMLTSVVTTSGFEPRIFTLSFSLLTAFLLLGQWLLSLRWGGWLFWPFFVVIPPVLELPVVQAFATTPDYDGLLILVAAAGWIITLRWLAVARRIPPLQFNFSQTSERHGNTEAQMATGLLKLSFAGTRSPFNTLLRGAYDNWRNRISTQIFLFAGFPLMMAALMALPAWLKGRPLSDKDFNPNIMLMYGMYGCLLGGLLAREWLARMRVLWLRVAGNREQLWHRLEQQVLGEIKLSILIAGSYAGIIWWLSALPAERAILFTVISATLLVFCTYFALYQRAAGLNNAYSFLVMIGTVIATTAAVLTAHFRDASWPIGILVLALPVGSLILRRLAYRHFLTIDWCQIRPTVVSRFAATEPR